MTSIELRKKIVISPGAVLRIVLRVVLIVGLSLVLAVISTGANAEEKTFYRIETVLFKPKLLNTKEYFDLVSLSEIQRRKQSREEKFSGAQVLGSTEEEALPEEQHDESLPEPAIKLVSEPENKLMTEIKNKLKRNYRILWHYSWISELPPGATQSYKLEEQAVAEDAYNLNGYLIINRNRYLHMKTDLRLQEPFSPEDLIEFARISGLSDLKIDSNADASLYDGPYSDVISTPTESEIQTSFGDDLQNSSQSTAEQTDESGRADGLNGIDAFNPLNDPEAENIQLYPSSLRFEPKTIEFALKQGRRLKSGELHYIDHPSMGLLVRFTPLEEEEVEIYLNERDGLENSDQNGLSSEGNPAASSAVSDPRSNSEPTINTAQ